jgi:hypothetical protein
VHQRREVENGDRFGDLTVIKPDGKDRHGHLQYQCRCECGSIVSVISSFLFQKRKIQCKLCAQKAVASKRLRDIVGMTIHGWRVIELIGRAPQGAYLYRCLCIHCGNITVKTAGSIHVKKGDQCLRCHPDYQFQISGSTAIGKLPNGSQFYVNTPMVPIISKMRWCMDSSGYIIHNERGKKAIYLHRFVLGLAEDSIEIIDHINRNKLDCRIENLRSVTVHQNCLNRNRLKNNTSGFTGVCRSSDKRTYVVRIGLFDRDIYLGRTKDPVLGAQMYNVAAILLFGDYVGQLNDVPEPDNILKNRVTQICQPYLQQARSISNPPRQKPRACSA